MFRCEQLLQRKERDLALFVEKTPDQAGVFHPRRRIADEVVRDQRIDEHEGVERRFRRLPPPDVHQAASLRNQHVMIGGVGVEAVFTAAEETVVERFHAQCIAAVIESDQAFGLFHAVGPPGIILPHSLNYATDLGK